MAPTPRLVVVGSANVDLAVATSTLPRAGETVLGGDIVRTVGGKGANQAVAAARLGAVTSFVGCVGRDGAGDEILATLDGEGVDTRFVKRSARPTGTALIVTDSSGDNVIVVSPGANLETSLSDVSFDEYDGALVQMEIPIDVVTALVVRQTRVVVNASPVTVVDRGVLRASAAVIVNEVESTGLPMRDLERCVVTRGSRGAALFERGRVTFTQPAPSVDVVDSVGAGDAFAAAFTVRFLAGDSDADALRYAVCAGSLATLGAGAQRALPTDVEVRSWLQRGW